ncbi:Nuclear transport factor 2 (NTF2) family protein [Raphanus sativus]|uniref:Uncharacterized protein LOC108831113 n=1 Tax=Raphanus sativus TaxID=3726 RepID=A0A6J0LJR3_RAPSA|nr:uncharacterized protein LOC108831113 [Raphanus sativus]KAJ4870723.1 Nuclear transport factor 2 (NTF2) family protein [Raphanus sativus]
MNVTTSLISSLRSSSPLGTKVVTPRRTVLSRRQLSTSYVPDTKAALPSSRANNVVPKSTPAFEIVSSFYTAINGNDLSSARDLIAKDCVYEDLIFSSPFVGRTAILEFFGKFIEATSTDMQFVIDDISKEDSSAVGVSWHLEWKGKKFPFSRSCSFYRLEVIDGKKQIVYVRDCVEPAIKPGESVIAAVKGVAWLLRKFPQLADRF